MGNKWLPDLAYADTVPDSQRCLIKDEYKPMSWYCCCGSKFTGRYGFLLEVVLDGRSFYCRTTELPIFAALSYGKSLQRYCTDTEGELAVPPPWGFGPHFLEADGPDAINPLGKRLLFPVDKIRYPGYFDIDKLKFQDMKILDWYEVAHDLLIPAQEARRTSARFLVDTKV